MCHDYYNTDKSVFTGMGEDQPEAREVKIAVSRHAGDGKVGVAMLQMSSAMAIESY